MIGGALLALARIAGKVSEGKQMLELAKRHPWAAGALVFVAGLAILFWWRSGSSGSSGSSAAANNAGAFYAAEAAQTQAGTALQMTTLQTAAATAGARIQADAALGIAQTQAARDVQLGNQQATTDQLAISTSGSTQGLLATLAQALQWHLGDLALWGQQDTNATTRAVSSDQLISSNTSNFYAAQTAQHASDTALAAQQAAGQTQQNLSWINTIIPLELAHTGGDAFIRTPGFSADVHTGNTPDPNSLRQLGFTEAQIAAAWG
jgi:hypothetical protein